MSMTTLLPCPFCGQQPTEYAIEPHTHVLQFAGGKMPDHQGSHVIECACGCGMIEATREAVAAVWNRRPTQTYKPDTVNVKKEDANNYCRILAALGMEEEGDPVAEVQKLLAAAAAPVVLPEEIPASNTLWMFLTKGMTQSAIADMPERDRKVLTERAQENWAAIRTEVGATAPVVLPEPVAYSLGLAKYAHSSNIIAANEFTPDAEHAGEWENLYAEQQVLNLLAGGSAPAAPPERKYVCPVRTIADLVNNLLLMDQALPIYGAQYIEHPAGRRRAIAVPPTVSIERVKDSRWIGEGETLNTAIVWTRAEQPAVPQAQADTRDARIYTYSQQPTDNVIAWRFGEACSKARPGGDYIDHGLSLLQQLQEKGYGITAIPNEQGVK